MIASACNKIGGYGWRDVKTQDAVNQPASDSKLDYMSPRDRYVCAQMQTSRVILGTQKSDATRSSRRPESTSFENALGLGLN